MDGNESASVSYGGAPLTVFYDYDCNFCVLWIAALVRLDGLRFVPILAEGELRRLGDLSPEQRLASGHAATAAGERWSGGHAFARLLARPSHGAWPAALAARAANPLGAAYRLVARNRTTLSWLVPAAAKAGAPRVVAARRAAERCAA